MTITIYYDSMGEKKSQMLSLQIIRDYVILLHFMEVEGEAMCAISQSRALTETEFEELWKELSVSFQEKRIPTWILEDFEERIELE
jgi:hypothetical protein